jgi:hypothetical protein
VDEVLSLHASFPGVESRHLFLYLEEDVDVPRKERHDLVGSEAEGLHVQETESCSLDVTDLNGNEDPMARHQGTSASFPRIEDCFPIGYSLRMLGRVSFGTFAFRSALLVKPFPRFGLMVIKEWPC